MDPEAVSTLRRITERRSALESGRDLVLRRNVQPGIRCD